MKIKSILLTLLTALLLIGFAYVTPWPSFTEEALQAHLNDSASEAGDYSFLFDD